MTRQLAKIIADSTSPHGVRLTTMEIEIPRIVLAELNTHRQFSRNSASSRAVPVEKMLQRVIDDPYIPEEWTYNGAGMQGHGVVTDPAEIAGCVADWLSARDQAVEATRRLLARNIHKQTTNRLIEAWMWHTVITTATEWSNFFNQRCHPDAHPAIRNTAEAMRAAMKASTPTRLEFGEWHLPYVDERDASLRTADKIKVSVARCARVSYLTHDGVRDPQADIDLHDRLLSAGHMSPLEHAARPLSPADLESDWPNTWAGNFRGWMQYRKTIKDEADILAHRSNDAC